MAGGPLSRIFTKKDPVEELEALRAALKPFAAIDLTTNQAVDAIDVLRARRALNGDKP